MPLPELVYCMSSKRHDFEGYLVIDSLIDNVSSGGLRMSTTVTVDEVKALARNMTLKYAFLGIPRGGAKSGIRINAPLSTTKKMILVEFASSLRRFIKSGLYTPGSDIGTTYEDITLVLEIAKGQSNLNAGITTNQAEIYTGWTMLSSAKQALAVASKETFRTRREKPLKLEGTTVAIEGFGKIGSSAAKVFFEAGAKVVAISTCEGAIYDPHGLDINVILEMRGRFGDKLVTEYSRADRIPKERLFDLPVDVLLPCAGSWSVNSMSAPRIKARIVCPGANLPYTNEAERYLFNRGVVCVPDFVSNSGVVLCAYMGNSFNEARKREFIDVDYGQRVYKLLKVSKQRGISPREVAVRIALRRFYDMKQRDKTLSRLLIKALRFTIPDKHLKMLGKPLLPYVKKRRMRLAKS